MRSLIAIFLFLLSTTFSYAEINEYKSDVYFANGINTKRDGASKTRYTIAKLYKLHNPTFYKSVNAWKVSVNHTEGIGFDLAESFEQKMNTEWYGVLYRFYSAVKKFVLALTKEAVKSYAKDEAKDLAKSKLESILFSHDDDLDTQIKAYKKSIKDGHGVIVLAHSQGNLFTVEAFDELDNWMKPYFHTLSIASPANSVPNNGPHITFDNDAILSIPFSQGANVHNPTRQVFWLDPNAQSAGDVVACPTSYALEGTASCSVADAIRLDTLTINAHFISYYLSNHSTRKTILDTIDTFIDKHHKSPSQWVIKKAMGCPGRCDYRLSLKHFTDVGQDNLYWYKPKIVMNEPVIPFIPREKTLIESRYGKLYKVQDKYVKTDKHYAQIREKSDEEGVCEVTKSLESDAILAKFEGIPYPKSKTVKGGVVGVMLTWDMCYPDVDLDLEVDWDAGYLDVHNDENSSFEHFVIESEHDIFPSDDPHSIYARDKTDHSKIDPKRIAMEDPIDIAVIAYAPGTNKTIKTKITRLDQLNLGHILDIYAKKSHGYPGRFIGGVGDIYQKESNPDPRREKDPCEGDKSCGCIPCEYKIVGYLKMALMGPISGGTVKIYSVDEGSVVYEGQTRKSDDITEAGVIDIPESKLGSFKDDGVYLIEVSGGEDIDNNDDFYVDAVPTQNKGVLHAIVTGKELKYLSFKVNILSEIAYQVSKDLLGGDKKALRDHLNDVAKRIFRRKVLSMDGSYEIDYDDILVWIPSVDKKNLKKNYDTFVEPIVKKVYANEDHLKLSYDFVYEKAEENAPELSALYLKIPRQLPKNAVIGNFNIRSKGDGEIAKITLAGEGSKYFTADKDGMVSVAQPYESNNKTFFTLKAVAINDNNHSSVPVDLSIAVVNNKGIVDENASVPYLKSMTINSVKENSVAGTPVGKVEFADDNNTILFYEVSGKDKEAFKVLFDGNIIVSNGADIDYEKQDIMYLDISAVNGAGNKSFPVQIAVKVKDVLDTPAYKLFLTKHIKENTPIGSPIAKLERAGGDNIAITSIDILNKNTPFYIDVDGIIRTIDYIDYERKNEYNLVAVARSATGNSNKIFVTIYIDDIDPETGLPKITDFETVIPEDIVNNSVIGTIHIDAGNSPVDEIRTYGDTGTDDFVFDKNGTIRIAPNASIDFETKKRYEFHAIAYNHNGGSNIANIVINVSNVADTVPKISGFTASYKENIALDANTTVGKIRVLDTGEGNISSYYLKGEDSQYFTIDNNGTVKLKQNMIFDFETKANYRFYVRANNIIGRSNKAEINVRIEDVLDSPPHIIKRQYSIEENATKGTLIGKVKVDPKYENGITKFKITEDKDKLLQIDQNGSLLLAKEGILDYEKSHIYLFSVSAVNQFGESSPVMMRLAVLDRGTAPTVDDLSITVPFDRNLKTGLLVGTISIDDGDSPVTDIALYGTGDKEFDIDTEGKVTLASDIETNTTLSTLHYKLKVMAKNKFGNSRFADLNISFEDKPEIDAGEDKVVFANKAFSLNGKIDESYRKYIKEIRWSSPDTDKIDCVDANNTECQVSQGLLAGSYQAKFSVEYKSGWIQEDTLNITVSPDPLDNVLGVLEKPLKGLKKMKLSSDGSRIYAIGNFEGNTIFKVIDVSNPENMHIIGSYDYGFDDGGEDFDLDTNETKAVIVGSLEMIAIDISNIDDIRLISHRHTNVATSIRLVQWYKNNQVLAYDYNSWYEPYYKIRMIDINDMSSVKTFVMDSGVSELLSVPDRNIFVFSGRNGIRIFDVNQSQIIFESNDTASNLYIDRNASKLVYNGTKKVYHTQGKTYSSKPYIGLLNLDDISPNSSVKEVMDNTSNNREVYRVDGNYLHIFDSGYYHYSIINRIKISDINKTSIDQILRIKGNIGSVVDDAKSDILYIYSDDDGLKAISKKKQKSVGRFIYQFNNDNYGYSYGNILFLNRDYLYYSSFYSTNIIDIQNLYKPQKIGSIEVYKSCYPNCGYEDLGIMGIRYAKVVDGQMHIVEPGDPISHFILDINDKNQSIILQLPSKFDYHSTLGEEFVMTRDQRYIYTPYTKTMGVQGLSVLDTELDKQMNHVLINDRMGFSNLLLSSDEETIYALAGGNLLTLDISDRNKIKIIAQTDEANIQHFVLSKMGNFIYVASEKKIDIFAINNTIPNKINSVSLPFDINFLSLSPNQKFLAVSTEFGIRIYDILDTGLLNINTFRDIVYPVTYFDPYINQIKWIDNNRLVAGGFIVDITK